MKEKIACVFVIIVVSLLMLSQIMLSQVDPLKPAEYSLETVQDIVEFYRDNQIHYPRSAIVYNYSTISIYLNLINLVPNTNTYIDMFFFQTYLYLYPWNQYFDDFFCSAALLYYSATHSELCIICSDMYGGGDFYYKQIYYSGPTTVNFTVTVLGYEITFDNYGSYVYIREYLNFKIYLNNVLSFDENKSKVFEIENFYSLTSTDPSFYVKERRIDVDFMAFPWGSWTGIIASWGYLVKYYVPSTPTTTTSTTETTTTTTTTTSSETSTETSTTTTTTTIPPPPPPDHEIWRTNYYEASPIIKMSINDAIQNNLYIYRRNTQYAWDYIYIYHFLTMRSFIYLLDSNHTVYLLVLTDEGETFKHKMILYDATNNTVLLQYEFHSLDSFVLKTINGELNYNFYRSKYGRSLIVKKERLIKLGNEFKLYPILSTVHYITVNTRTDKLNLKIYMPYRFNNSRIDYGVAIALWNIKVNEYNQLEICRSTLNTTTLQYSEKCYVFTNQGEQRIKIEFKVVGGIYLNETYFYINSSLYPELSGYFTYIPPYERPFMSEPDYSFVSEILLELDCELNSPNSLIQFVVSTGAAIRVETTQLTLLSLSDVARRNNLNETHLKMYLQLWMRGMANVEIIRGNTVEKTIKDLLFFKEGNCSYGLSAIVYDQSRQLYKAVLTKPMYCPAPTWSVGFESMSLTVQSKGFTITVFGVTGRRDYYTEIVMPDTQEYREYSYQGYISAFIITNNFDVIQYASSKRLRIQPTFVKTMKEQVDVETFPVPTIELPDWWNILGWLSLIGNLMITYLSMLINFIAMVFSTGIVYAPMFLRLFGLMYLLMLCVFAIYNPAKLIYLHMDLFHLIEKLLHRLWDILVRFVKAVASIISALKPI